MKVLAPLLAITLALAIGPAAASVADPPLPRTPGPPQPAVEEQAMGFDVSSSAFDSGGDIPKSHTCDGKDVSPPLAWRGTPQGTRSLALIVDDPDAPDPAAPRMVWVHWVIYNLPAALKALPEGAAAKALPKGTLEGLNDWKHTGWRGPCPPVGRHRYFFKLYALDTVLPDLKKPTKSGLERAMEGHVLAKAELVGHYAHH